MVLKVIMAAGGAVLAWLLFSAACGLAVGAWCYHNDKRRHRKG